MRYISVMFAIDDEIEKELDLLLPLFQNYRSPVSGEYPFSHYDKDCLFRSIMQNGCIPHAKDKIRYIKKVFQSPDLDILV